MILFNTIKRMIELGRTIGLAEKIDVFYAGGKINDEQYNELTAMLEGK